MPIKSLAVFLALAMGVMFMAAGCRDDKSSSSSSASSSSSSSSQSSSSSSEMSPSSVMSEIMGESGSGSAAQSSAEGSQSMTSNSTSGSGSTSASGQTGSSSEAAPAMAASASDWQLRLVNFETPLPDDFEVETVPIKGYENRLFDKRAADALQNMLTDAEKAGRQLYLVSAYRSVARQQALFERKTAAFMSEGFPRAEAEKQAAMWVARPGTSEHNVGLAADIVSANWYSENSDLTEEFENTPEFEWLSQNAASYGFILRYPKGKEAITGVTYEPWHYRYVGEAAAKEISQKGITLEEYLNAA